MARPDELSECAFSRSYDSKDQIGEESIDGARWQLARLIYETIERLDPTGAPSFDELPEYDRNLYHEVVMTLLAYRDLVSLSVTNAHL